MEPNIIRFRIALGARARKLRTSCGVTLADCSRETGLSEPTLSRFERGETDISLYHGEQLARYFDVRLVDLIKGLI